MPIDLARDLGIKGSLDTEASEERSGTAKSRDVVKIWLDELDDARKREKDFRKDGRRIVSIYEAGEKDKVLFNILYSNTETMQPALYNSTPRPVVSRRFKDEDPLGMAAGKICERTLSYLIDDGNALYTSFDELMKSATLEALLPGRGVTWFKYDASLEKVQNEREAEAAEAAEGIDTVEEGETLPEAAEEPAERVQYETVCGEEVPWDRFLHGSAKKWKDVPWVSREHFMTREELEDNFGALGAKVPVMEQATERDDEDRPSDKKECKGMKVAAVYEIWNKLSKEVLFVSPAWKDEPLKVVPDPLGLAGFFPCPRPMGFVSKISDLVPVALYALYEGQAQELNIVTARIRSLIKAMKVRGMYDQTVEGIENVLNADDNILVPAQNVAALLAGGNALEKAIWLMPIEKWVSVLQQLYLEREQTKTIIYELTGIADIMRGSSAASETLGAQQIKTEWGTLRLKKAQKEVMRYVRDCLRIVAEIAVTKLSIETLRGMTGLKYPTQEEKQQAQMAAQQMQQQAQMTGQPPPPPPPQLVATLNSPTWEELMAVLQNDTQRAYRIDIETNSTVDAEATEDKKDIGELLNSMAQFLNGIQPLIEKGIMPFDAAKGILLAVVRRYRFGPELEDQLKLMQGPEGGGAADGEAVKKKEEELGKKEQELQKAEQQLMQQAAKAKADLERQQMELQLKQQEFEMQQQFAAKVAQMQHQFDMKELALTKQQLGGEVQQQMRAAEQSVRAKQQAAQAQSQARRQSTKV